MVIKKIYYDKCIFNDGFSNSMRCKNRIFFNALFKKDFCFLFAESFADLYAS
jgi:hypothetical protein